MIEEFIKHYCEDCKKELTMVEWEEHFNKKHKMRIKGQFIIKDPNKELRDDEIIGIAKEDSKQKGYLGEK